MVPSQRLSLFFLLIGSVLGQQDGETYLNRFNVFVNWTHIRILPEFMTKYSHVQNVFCHNHHPPSNVPPLETGALLDPCNVEDLACLSRSTEQFLNQTAGGIPQVDIKPIDPMFFPSIESDLKSVKYTFTNLTLFGLKNQKIADFSMEQNAKTVVLKTNVDVHYVSNVDMNFKMPVKSFSGSYAGNGKALMTSTYSYSIKPNDKGVDHFEVGKETITCEALEADANISAELSQLLDTDPEIRELRQKMMEKREQMLKTGLCKLLEIAYPTVIHNIRASAKFLPKTAFFKNIKS